jgi:hypothetical protein
MLRFLRWLAAAVFVSLVIGGVAGGISGWNARRVAELANPNRPSVYFQNLEEEVIGRVFYWTTPGVFVLLIFAARVKLPEPTKDIAWGALAGAVIAVIGGNLVSALRGEPGTPAKNYPESIRLTLLYGLPILTAIGGVVGFMLHLKRKQRRTEIADTDATGSPQSE